MLKVALFAALPEESRCLKSCSGPWRRTGRRPAIEYRRSFGDKEAVLLETGMGEERIAQSLARLAERGIPDIIISFGFGGALTEALPVGSVALGMEFVHWNESCMSAPACIKSEIPDDMLLDLCRQQHVSPARIVTMDRPRPKPSLSPLFSEAPTVMDMESYFVARFALEKGVPFLCFRAISDGLADEIEYDLDAISSDGRVRVHKVLALIAGKPRLIPAFYASWRRSLKAARELARVMSAFLNMPARQIRNMITGCCPERDLKPGRQ